MRLHIVMHESFEAPAAILDWAVSRGHDFNFSRVYKNEALPELGSFDFLIIMGGPQSPATTKLECPYYDATAEKLLIKNAVEGRKIVLGVCLGAQLIGDALGGHFEHSPNREIGVFEVKLTNEAENDPIFAKFPKQFHVGHWHGDMPGMTKDSVVLAFSDGCPRQIVRYAPKVYGFQCHFEFTHNAIDAMIENSREELEKYKSLPFVEGIEELRGHDFRRINELLFTFLDHVTGDY